MCETALCIFCKGVMSWLCLACRRTHAVRLSKFAGPSFLFVLSLKFLVCCRQLKKIAEQTTDWRSCLHEPCLRLPTQLAPRDCVLGVLIWVQFWALFRVHFLDTVLVPNELKEKSWGPKAGPNPKMEPKQFSKLDPNQDPQNAIPGRQLCRKIDATKVL